MDRITQVIIVLVISVLLGFFLPVIGELVVRYLHNRHNW